MSKVLQKIVVALGDRSYPIIIGRSLLADPAAILPFAFSGKAIFVLADKEVQGPAETLVSTLRIAGARTVNLLSITGGERAKSMTQLEQVLSWLLDAKVDRHAILFVVGGGVIGDLGGFAASIIMRGIPFVQVPTTLLAQVDSSVGGKTGINMPQGKNLVGAFHQPICVLADLDLLKTLPRRELLAGYAEVVKYGLINDAAFFKWLEDNAKQLLALDEASFTRAIAVSCQKKADIVAADEREQDQRALLNLGHTFGHALEVAAGFDGRLLHGEAVAIGMVLAFQLSSLLGLAPAVDTARVINHLKSCGLPTAIRDIQPGLNATVDELLGYMLADKKAESGRAVFILTRGIGHAFIDKTVDMAVVRRIVEQSIAEEEK